MRCARAFMRAARAIVGRYERSIFRKSEYESDAVIVRRSATASTAYRPEPTAPRSLGRVARAPPARAARMRCARGRAGASSDSGRAWRRCGAGQRQRTRLLPLHILEKAECAARRQPLFAAKRATGRCAPRGLQRAGRTPRERARPLAPWAARGHAARCAPPVVPRVVATWAELHGVAAKNRAERCLNARAHPLRACAPVRPCRRGGTRLHGSVATKIGAGAQCLRKDGARVRAREGIAHGRGGQVSLHVRIRPGTDARSSRAAPQERRLHEAYYTPRPAEEKASYPLSASWSFCISTLTTPERITNLERCTVAHICTGTGLTPPTSAPGLGSPLPHLHRDWGHRCYTRAVTTAGPFRAHVCTGTG